MKIFHIIAEGLDLLKYLTKRDIILAVLGYVTFMSIVIALFFYEQDDMSDVNHLLSRNFSEQYKGIEFISFSVACQHNRQYATFKLTPFSEPHEYEFRQDKSLCPAPPEKDFDGKSSFTIHRSRDGARPAYHIHTTGEELLDPYTPEKAQYYITLVNLAFAQIEYESAARYSWGININGDPIK